MNHGIVIFRFVARHKICLPRLGDHDDDDGGDDGDGIETRLVWSRDIQQPGRVQFLRLE